jgi:acetoin utilization deacetylase AcuC-like enzyme
MAMGFCYFNNVAVSAEYLIRQHGLDRAAIVDFDVHHGNGTQHLFEDRGDVLYVSAHQHPLFPGTGAAGERGHDGGIGATLNLPLPAGTGDARYAEVFAEEILPRVREFEPDVLLVSAGFDAWQADPVGGMRVSLEAFEEWGKWLRRAADDLCDGRMFVTLEGGYDLHALSALVVAYCRGMESDES